MSLTTSLNLIAKIGLDSGLSEKMVDLQTVISDADLLALSNGVLSQLASLSETDVPFGDVGTSALVILRSATAFNIKLNGGAEVIEVGLVGEVAIVILTAVLTGVVVVVPGGAAIDVVYAVAGS